MDRYLELGDVSPDVLITEIYSRLQKILRYIKALLSLHEQMEQMDDNFGDEEEERLVSREENRLRRAFGLPEDMWELGA